MIKDKLSKRVFYGMFLLQLMYIVIVLIAILIKAYRFSDLAVVLVYVSLGSIVSITLSIVHINQLTKKGIALKDSLISFLLMQLPSTFLFLLSMLIVLTTEYIFD